MALGLKLLLLVKLLFDKLHSTSQLLVQNVLEALVRKIVGQILISSFPLFWVLLVRLWTLGDTFSYFFPHLLPFSVFFSQAYEFVCFVLFCFVLFFASKACLFSRIISEVSCSNTKISIEVCPPSTIDYCQCHSRLTEIKGLMDFVSDGQELLWSVYLVKISISSF